MARRKIDKQALASLIRESRELSNDQKADLLQLLNEQKRYGLVWESHKEDAEELLEENIPVLVEDDSKRILSPAPKGEGWGGAPDHILIEGDNLHALTALTYTHEGKVDVIYIDPPYNTGNKDFVYNDKFVDSEDGYRHSKWLSFMEKRLRIAKKLLSDRGVIFISIDDNEQANLKLLCDEVFGESRFIANFCRTTGTTTGQDANKIGSSFDYCLLYSKTECFILNGVPLDDKDLKRFKDKDEVGFYSTLQLRKTGNADTREERPNMFYAIVAPDGSEVYPFGPTGYLSRWRVGKELYNQWEKENLIVWKYNENEKRQECDGYVRSKWTPHVKYYSEGRTKQVSNLIQEIEGNKKASLTLKEIFGEKGTFDNPKPVEFLKLIETISSDKDSTILDFFAGSGTTLHATMQLNAEDGGHRQCILVTNNENNICEEVTYERNKRVINGYTTPKGVEVEGLHNNNLRYYKTAFVPREKTAANRHALMNMSTDLLCIKENMYNEQPFEVDGKKMKPEFVRYFVSDAQDMIIIYDPRAVAFVAKALPQDSQKKIMVYVYSDGQYAYNDEFHGKNIELCALPDAIYQALSRVLPPMKEVEMNIEQEGTL